jgi:hypothetical protein
MAGKIIADQIEHSTAGSIATNYVVNGSAKMFYNLNGTGTIALRDSLNISSATDKGSGDYKVAFTSNFNATDYTPVGNHGTTDTNWNSSYQMAHVMGSGISNGYAAVYTTSELGFCNYGSGTPAGEDIEMELGNAMGDLA